MEWIISALLYGSLIYLLISLLLRDALRWPLAVVISAITTIELLLYFALRYSIHLLELFRFTVRKSRKLRLEVRTGDNCDSFADWQAKAEQLDRVDGRDKWKETPESEAYNHALIATLNSELKKHIQEIGKMTAGPTLPYPSSTNDDASPSSTSSFSSTSPLSVYANSNDSTSAIPRYQAAALPSTDPIALRSKVLSLHQILHSCMRRNVAGIMNEPLYSQTNTGTKKNIEQFVDNVVTALNTLADTDALPLEQRLQMLTDFKRSFGYSALCLSGGGGLGLYHLGVVRALLKEGLLPRILSGASAGGLIGAHICCRTNEELEKTLNPECLVSHMQWDNGLTWMQKAAKYIRDGYMFDTNQWVKSMRWHTCGDMTFREAFAKSGRSLVITATPSHHHEPPLFLSHITTPNVLVWSAIIASASVPGLLPLAQLYEKDDEGNIRPCKNPLVGLRDGSFKSDIPTSELSFYFNVSFFAVSQVNPHIAPFFFFSQGDAGRGIGRWVGWRGGYVLSFLESLIKNDMRKNVSVMRDMGLFPSFFGADWSLLFLQNFEGHVTLVPPLELYSYIHIIDAPSVKDLEHYFKQGQMMVWRKMSLLRTRLAISKTLSAAIERVSSWLTKHSPTDLRRFGVHGHFWRENVLPHPHAPAYFAEVHRATHPNSTSGHLPPAIATTVAAAARAEIENEAKRTTPSFPGTSLTTTPTSSAIRTPAVSVRKTATNVPTSNATSPFIVGLTQRTSAGGRRPLSPARRKIQPHGNTPSSQRRTMNETKKGSGDEDEDEEEEEEEEGMEEEGEAEAEENIQVAETVEAIGEQESKGEIDIVAPTVETTQVQLQQLHHPVLRSGLQARPNLGIPGRRSRRLRDLNQLSTANTPLSSSGSGSSHGGGSGATKVNLSELVESPHRIKEVVSDLATRFQSKLYHDIRTNVIVPAADKVIGDRSPARQRANTSTAQRSVAGNGQNPSSSSDVSRRSDDSLVANVLRRARIAIAGSNTDNPSASDDGYTVEDVDVAVVDDDVEGLDSLQENLTDPSSSPFIMTTESSKSSSSHDNSTSSSSSSSS